MLASENFTSQHWTETLKCSAEIKLDDILKVETISKPLSFAEVNLLKALLRRWQGFIKTRRLTKKYFSSWKAYWKKSAAMQGESTSQKIDNLISALHQMKIKRRKFERSNSDEPSPSDKLLRYRANSLSNECFRHRFKTQKEIIDTQKAKLEEQSRIIQDLKLGIIRDELSKSLEHTRSELREIFSKSSHKLKCKTAPSGIKLEDTLANFIINSNKAPKFLQQMEMRALERARNREIIRERKRIIDEEKQRAFEQTVEQKRKQDEEEKRRGLEAIKEKQRAELERQKLIQMNKEIYLANVKKADRFFKRNIMKKCMNRLQHNVYRSKNNMLQAERFHERTLKKTAIRRWKQYIEGKYKEQNEKADVFLRKFLLTETFKLWKDVSLPLI